MWIITQKSTTISAFQSNDTLSIYPFLAFLFFGERMAEMETVVEGSCGGRGGAGKDCLSDHRTELLFPS